MIVAVLNTNFFNGVFNTVTYTWSIAGTVTLA